MKGRSRRQRGKRQRGNWGDDIEHLKTEEWEKLRASIDSIRDKLMLMTLYSSGCRVGELCLMRIEDIDFQNHQIKIPAKNTKTKQGRTSRISPELANDLKAFLRMEKRDQGFLFLSRSKKYDGKRTMRGISPRRIRQILNKYAKKAGLQSVRALDKRGRKLSRIHPHTLRHTHVVHALWKKVPINAVQQQVGHRSLETTQIYARLSSREARDAYDEAGFE